MVEGSAHVHLERAINICTTMDAHMLAERDIDFARFTTALDTPSVWRSCSSSLAASDGREAAEGQAAFAFSYIEWKSINTPTLFDEFTKR